jgi:serine/threonine-protein kinase
VYGLGAILYALLTGLPPVRGSTPLDTVRAVVEADPTPPRVLNPRVDPGLQAVCLKCLEKDPRHRYASAADLAADLDRYLAGGVPLAAREGWTAWLGRQVGRAIDFPAARRWAYFLAALAVLNAAAGVALQLGLQAATSAGAFWAWFLAVTLVTEWVPLAAFARLSRPDPRDREVLLFWAGVAAGRVILFANHCPTAGETSVREVAGFFSSSLVLYGVMLFAEGRLYWGRLYLLGLADFAAAVGLLGVPAVAPLAHGLWQAGVIAVIARHLARVAADRARLRPPADGPPPSPEPLGGTG